MYEDFPKQIKKLKVSAQGQQLGILTHESNHFYQPTQDTLHVSLTMTGKGYDGYSNCALHPIFSQNLPEGVNRRYIAQKLARYAKVDDMYLLSLQGDSGIGQLCFDGGYQLPSVEPMELADIINYDGSTPLFPQLIERYYLRNTLSGMQPKVSISTGRTVQQADLIVKACDEEFPLLTVNEFVCMEAARFCGLNPPKTYLSENLETFVIERFDTPDPNVFSGCQLGYEDFTVLLGKSNSPDAKYTGSYETLLKATAIYTGTNYTEIEKMYRYIVFNCLIGNGDAHLKNFALQYTPDMQNIFVSPPFDITHTPVYPTLNITGVQMALKMAKSKEFPDRKTLLNLAESKEFKLRDAKEIIESTAEGILQSIEGSSEVSLIPGLRESIIKSVDIGASLAYNNKGYRHAPKRKYPR